MVKFQPISAEDIFNPLDKAPHKGLLGMFKDPEALKKAAEKVRDKNIKLFDAYTPFPVHGLERSMGLKTSFLPWITFIAGLSGGSFGLFFQWWTSAVDWGLNVGGKPLDSWPAFIPITFECTILFAGLATAGALIAVCGLPCFHIPPLDPSLTNDRFGLYISSKDKAYSENELKEILKSAGAYEVRVI